MYIDEMSRMRYCIRHQLIRYHCKCDLLNISMRHNFYDIISAILYKITFKRHVRYDFDNSFDIFIGYHIRQQVLMF